jgi:hypothetical protein
MDDPVKVLNVTCPFCSYTVPLLSDGPPHKSVDGIAIWYAFRGCCRGCSRFITLNVRPYGQAQRAYGKRWFEFWRKG